MKFLKASRLRATLLLVLTVSLVMEPFACAPAPRSGQFVNIYEEAAVIVWDAKTRTEHFIRTAAFGGAEDFGFLVPTPTKPELAEARDALQTVSQLIRPKYVTERRFDGFDLTPLLFMPFLSMKEESTGIPASAVRVLEEKQVAGYDAVVLEADNAQSLNEWLAKHGYESRPALVEWLEPYVKAHWKITAFKIAANGSRFSTQPVRMSFTADKPFFPYREPADLRDEKPSSKLPRTLKVFLLSDARMQGTVGTQPWQGEVTWANPIQEADRQSIARDCGLAGQQLPANLWLTTFEDKSSPRLGTDELFFSAAATQNTVTPPPVVLADEWQVPLPLDLLLLLVAFPSFLWFRRKRKIALR